MRLLHLLRCREKLEIEQMDTGDGLHQVVVLAAAELFGQGAGQVIDTARTPQIKPSDLHFNVEQLALPVPGQHIEHDEFASQLLGVDARIEDLNDFDRLIFMAHRIDQGRQQMGGSGEKPFEDVVVLGAVSSCGLAGSAVTIGPK